MTDNENKGNTGMTSGREKLRRRVHDRFISPRTQDALSDAIYSVPSVTVFDRDRIVEQLAERLNDYLHVSHFKEFRAKAVAFVMRQAQLTIQVRAMMPKLMSVARCIPGCRDFGHIAAMVYRRLPEYTGDVTDSDAIREWTEQAVQGEARGVVALAAWIEEHRKAVYTGLWDVLKDCLDLGIDGAVEELAADVWRWVSCNAVDLLNSEVPIHVRLRREAYWTARAWKTDRLNERKETGGKMKCIDRLTRSEDRTGVVASEIIDLQAIQNPTKIESLIQKISEAKWTELELERELRSAGPFRANDRYETVEELLMVA